MRKIWMLIIMFCLCIVSVPVSAAEPSIRVGLVANQPSVVISATCDYTIKDDNTEKVLGEFKPGEKTILARDGQLISINGKAYKTDMVSVIKKTNADNYIEVNKRLYRGSISIHKTINKNGLTVVNTLGLEDYLCGVIAMEISPLWNKEAVKAQAVAARSYAMANMGKFAYDGYDVSDGTDSQVYGGKSSEHPNGNAAVIETKGVVVTYKNKVISAFFHNNSGGYTENSENVWGTYLPYIRAVEDYDHSSPYYKWEKHYKVEDFEKVLISSGYNIGKLAAIQLSKLDKPPVTEDDRGVSGRIKSLDIIGTNGSYEISGNKLRSMFGLKSTLFDINLIVPPPSKLEIPITDSYGDREIKKVEVTLEPYKEKGFVADKENIRRVTGRPGEEILITGFGWGHGLGLSQWGAKIMAENGPKDDAEYYKTILKHYYQGVEITKLY